MTVTGSDVGNLQARAEFDSFAASYEKLHAHSIRLTGEEPEYFAAYKASYITHKLASGPYRVLDYGCGIGMLSRQLKLRLPQAQVDGFDPSQESLGRVDPSLLAEGVFTADLFRLRDDYDIIVMANVLHHVSPAQRDNVISDAASRLASTGKLIIFEHNPANPLTRWAVAQCVFDEDAVLLWPREASRRIRAAGLRTLKCDYIVFFPHRLRSLRPLEWLLYWCPAGAQYVLTGTSRK
jgi:2-polyprenyl-3-methyl-5-hydroxy-6-metoxy-1,4-benzoquinol methylase